MVKLRLIEGGRAKQRKRQVRHNAALMPMRQVFEAMAANPEATCQLLRKDLARLQRKLGSSADGGNRT